ncbi:MAG: immunoglobulin domain-containing protein [Opitutaceae bacterium]|jgi:hypothetical protein|nr:immunoglobulin domain-containing protein [Opitutaceae bacterium]
MKPSSHTTPRQRHGLTFFNKTPRALQLLPAVLLLGLVLLAGSVALRAQDGLAGTWFFTGLEAQGYNPVQRIENKVTIAGNGGTFTITTAWNNRTTSLPALTQSTLPIDKNQFPYPVWSAFSADFRGVRVAKVDADTWLLFWSVEKPDGRNYKIDVLSGVLTKKALPSPVTSNWTKNFTWRWMSLDDAEYETFFNENLEITKSGNVYYHVSINPESFWTKEFEYEYDSYPDLVGIYEVKDGFEYEYDGDGVLLHKSPYSVEDLFTGINLPLDGKFLCGSDLIYLWGGEDYAEEYIVFQLPGNRLGFALVGSDGASLSVAAAGILTATTGDSGNNNNGNNNNNNDTTPAGIAPVITTQPQGKTVWKNESVTLTVTATGTPAPTCQWYLNGKAIKNAKATSYTIPKAAAKNAGAYTVVVKNSAGEVTSVAATLTVNTPVKPKFSPKPASRVETAIGQSLTLTVAATGIPSPAYTWKLDGKTILGATDASLNIAFVSTADIGKYTVEAANSAGKVSATITVNAVIPPSFDTAKLPAEPAADAFTYALTGKGVKLTAPKLAKNKAKPAYQWLLNGIEISGTAAQKATFTAKSDGQYSVRVSNGAGQVEHIIANVRLITPPRFDNKTGLTASTTNAIAGESVTFTATLQPGTGTGSPLKYEWLLNGKVIHTVTTTATTQTYTASNLTKPGKYSVRVTNGEGKVVGKATAKAISIKIDQPGLAPASLPVGAHVAYKGIRKDKWGTGSYENTFRILESGRLAGTEYGDGGTYTYKRTGPAAATLTYTATDSDGYGWSGTEKGTIKIVFTSATSGTYTASGSYSVNDYGDRYSSSFKDTGTFTYFPQITPSS